MKGYNGSCWYFYPKSDFLLSTGQTGMNQIKNDRYKEVNKVGKIYCFAESGKFPEVIFLGLTDGFTAIRNSKDNSSPETQFQPIHK
ncbi:MAG: hypothetical protein ABII90_14860 [Bacteroidota bacterium]